MTISDDRLTSPKHLAFLQKLLDHHYWSADDYDSIPQELTFEIYGRAFRTFPPYSAEEQVLVVNVAAALLAAVDDPRRVALGVDVRVKDMVFKADAVLLREPFDGRLRPGGLVQIVVEVISSENIERTVKKAAYAAQGIPMYIVIDGPPGRRFAEVYRLGKGGYEMSALAAADVRMELAEPLPFVLDMKQINS